MRIKECIPSFTVNVASQTFKEAEVEWFANGGQYVERILTVERLAPIDGQFFDDATGIWRYAN